MEKHYSPEIEELYLGIEYQQFSHLNGRWENRLLDYNRFMTILDEENNDWSEHHIRIKYLDKEDIESLGFKLFNIREDRESIWCQFKHISDDLTQIHCQLGLKFINKNKGVRINLSTRYDGHIGIIIKNKSELKKLLKQLCITK